MIELLIHAALAFAGVLLGAYILFFGRRSLGATLGIVALAVAANVLAQLVAGADSGRDLVELAAWGLVAVAVVVGVLGVILARSKPAVAANVIGFIAGAGIALWLFDISSYTISAVTDMPEQAALWVGLALLLVGGLLGLWLMKREQDETLILLSVLVGVEVINDALQLNDEKVLTAIFLLSLALAGVLLQFGAYLREVKVEASRDAPPPIPSSLAYFQDLDLG